MPAPLWTHDQRLVRYAPVGPRVDSGTRLYFYNLNGPRDLKGRIPGAPHGMMWSATGPMVMHNGDYVDGTTRWLEGYVSAVSPDGSEGYFRHVRVDLRSFAVPCRVLVWGGRKDHGGTGARWLVLARGLAYDTPPTRRREPAEMAPTLAKRDHDWSELAEIHQHPGGTWQDCPSCSGCDVHRETGPGATRAMDAYRVAWLEILGRQHPGKVLRASVQQPRTSPAGERLARSGSMQGVPVGLLASWGGRAQNRNA